MYYIGIDLGCSNIKIVVFENFTLKEKRIFINDFQNINSDLIKKFIYEMCDSNEIELFITGGKSNYIKKEEFDFPVNIVNELAAIAYGGYYFYPFDKRFLVVSIGTGTAMVSFKYNEYRHIGGTGIGGGTLLGFTRFLFDGADVNLLFEFAQKGQNSKIDITVGDIVGSGIGIVPSDATASHLGNLKSNSSKESISFGIVNMVATEIANLAVITARAELVDKIIFIGTPLENRIFSDILIRRISMLEKPITPVVPLNPSFGTAIGAIYFNKFNKWELQNEKNN